ncbi:MAG: hypothetical protein FWH55_05030 [Oscillospiraceae bacterium]|nr:hypothetical protein [Oscillospiraceae bacterium]
MIFILIAIYIICSAAGLILIKLNADVSHLTISGATLQLNLSLTTILGLGLYVVSFLLWVVILQKMNLNYIYPVVIGISYIFIMLGSHFILKEPFAVKQLVGSGIILIGLVLMNMK